MNSAKLKKVSLIGISYAVCISSLISLLGGLMFAEWVSFLFFLMTSIGPSMVVFFIFMQLNNTKWIHTLMLRSLLLGLLVSFLSLFISTFLNEALNERIYWDFSTFEGFVWSLTFSFIGSILFIPFSYFFLKLNNSLSA